MAVRERMISELEETLGLRIQDSALYIRALTHSSYANEQKAKACQNERLELLGDSVLGLCITEHLFRSFPEWNEGRLSKLKSYIVSAESLAEAAREYALGRFILLGKGERRDGGECKASVLANVVEALIGACYLDQGLDTARQLVLGLMGGQLERYQNDSYSPQDLKLRLQEYAQKYYKTLPEYRTVELFDVGKNGPRTRGFEAALYVAGDFICKGEGRSKKQAEKQAAKKALEDLMPVLPQEYLEANNLSW
ncbi:MAG: ribonuclease III [Spirochaetota bacterium]